MSLQTLNVILFGETGVGKSSVINLMAGRRVAETSLDAEGCTMNSKDYKFNLPRSNRPIKLWDTVGLNEPQMGVNGYYDAIVKAYALIRKLSEAGGVDLLLFCIRGNRITATTQSNYRLFYEVLCNKQVPIALVITHLERENPMEDWWNRNKDTILNRYKIQSVGHACVTGLEAEGQKYQKSKDAMLDLLSQRDSSGRFSMPAEPWFIRLLQALASLLPGTPATKDVVRILMRRCNLDLETAHRLAGQLAIPTTGTS